MRSKYFLNIIFDCDSTLTKIEGLDEIARRKGIFDRISELTQQGVNGEIPYRVSFQKRWLEIVRPQKRDLEWLGNHYVRNLVEDADRVIFELQSTGCNIFILSHVPQPSIEILADFLRIPKGNIFAIPTTFGEDSIMEVSGDFLEDIEVFKPRVVKRIRNTGPTVLVGDGMTDLEAGRFADLFIGFGGVVKREKLRSLSSIYIEEPRLQPVIDIVLYKEGYAGH